MTSNGVYSNDPRPRLCHLRRWPDFVGYGFNLHCEKAKPGQYIGKVDPNSPAESAGLRESDRIIEVNFVPIGNENHKQVVARIKEGVSRNGTKYPEEVILLVLDPVADEYYKNKQIVVRSSDANVLKLEAEDRNPSGLANGDNVSTSSDRSVERSETPPPPPPPARNASNRDYIHNTNFTGPAVTHTQNTGSPTTSRTSDHDDNHDTYLESSPALNRNQRQEYPPPNNTYANVNPPTRSMANDFYARPTGNSPSQQSPARGSGSGVFELKMSAAEYREKLKSQNARRRDPRNDSQMSMKEKHDLIDRL